MSKKILIVDDEPYIQTLLRQALEDLEDSGVELLLVGDGQKAWELIQSERPDLIILDLMLPGLSGYEICERVKSDPALAGTHIIMLTAKGQAIDRKRGFDVGADEYITKPFELKLLVGRIVSALGPIG